MQLRETPPFNSINFRFGGPIRVPLANNVLTNLDYWVLEEHLPIKLQYKSQSINRIQNNIPNPYIKPNQPGIITAPLGQNILPVYANSNNI